MICIVTGRFVPVHVLSWGHHIVLFCNKSSNPLRSPSIYFETKQYNSISTFVGHAQISPPFQLLGSHVEVKYHLSQFGHACSTILCINICKNTACINAAKQNVHNFLSGHAMKLWAVVYVTLFFWCCSHEKRIQNLTTCAPHDLLPVMVVDYWWCHTWNSIIQSLCTGAAVIKTDLCLQQK